MRRSLFILTLFSLLILFATVSLPFEGIIIQKTAQINSGRNPGLDAMSKMLEKMPAAQKKMMEDRMKAAMGDKPSEQRGSTNTTYIKGSKMRVDFENKEGEKTFMVMDMGKRVTRNFFPQQKAYLETSLDELQQMSRGFSNTKKEMGSYRDAQSTDKLEKTGKKKRINGYMCEQYTQKVGAYTNEYWVTKEITLKQVMGGFSDYTKTIGEIGGQNAQHKAIIELDSYPILTVISSKYGTNRSEVIKIEEMQLASDLFDVPDGYKKQSMKDMMNR